MSCIMPPLFTSDPWVQPYRSPYATQWVVVPKPWECPRCHTINAPTVERCTCKPTEGG